MLQQDMALCPARHRFAAEELRDDSEVVKAAVQVSGQTPSHAIYFFVSTVHLDSASHFFKRCTVFVRTIVTRDEITPQCTCREIHKNVCGQIILNISCISSRSIVEVCATFRVSMDAWGQALKHVSPRLRNVQEAPSGLLGYRMNSKLEHTDFRPMRMTRVTFVCETINKCMFGEVDTSLYTSPQKHNNTKTDNDQYFKWNYSRIVWLPYYCFCKLCLRLFVDYVLVCFSFWSLFSEMIRNHILFD